MKLTPKQKRDKRRERALTLLQSMRLWLWCVIGVAVTLMLPGLGGGIAGVQFYKPNWTEVAVALGVGFVLVFIDEEIGGSKLITSRKVFIRKRKHAFYAGVGILGMIDRLTGGGQ